MADSYKGPTAAQIAAGTLEVGIPTPAHRQQARTAALIQSGVRSGQTSAHAAAEATKTIYGAQSEEAKRAQIILTREQTSIHLKKVSPPPSAVIHPIITTRDEPFPRGLIEYAVGPPDEIRRIAPTAEKITTDYKLAQKIKKRVVTGYEMGIGKHVDIEKMKPHEDTVPFEEYYTAPIHEKITSVTDKYEKFRKKAQEGIFGMPGGVVGQILTPMRKYGVGITRTPTIAMETAGMLPVGAEFFIREPVTAAKMVPIGAGLMVGGLVTGIRERPFETAGELTGVLLGPKVVTKIVPSPKIPTMPIIPKFPEVPIGLVPGKMVKFRSGAGIAAALEKAAPPIKKPLDFTQVKALGKAGTDVEGWIKAHPEQKTVIGGSAAARTQLKGARRPGDLDINVGDVSKAASELYEVVSKVHGKDKTKVSFHPEYGSAKVKVKTNGWHDAVDIHPTTPVGAVLRPGFPYKVQKPVRIGGIDYVPLGELIQRKAESVLQSRRAGTIGPEEWRLKDVGDFERFVSEALEHKLTKAQTAKMFKEYRKGKVKALEQELIEYETHVAYGPDPYQIRAAAVKYEKLPVTVKLPAATVVTAVSAYPREYEPLGEVAKVPSVYPPYKPPYKPYEPAYTPIGERPYKPPKKPPYTPAYKPPYAPPPYKPVPYAPPAYHPYLPPYAPVVSEPPLKTPYEPPVKLYKLKFETKPDKRKRRVKRKAFEYFIENPIASVFQPVKKGDGKKSDFLGRIK